MSKRKIGLVELYGHNEVLYILYRLLKDDFEISVFTTQEILIDAEDYFNGSLKNWYSQSEIQSKEQFIKTHSKELDVQDILIFITLISSFRFFVNYNFQAKTVLLVHNVNTMLLPKTKRWLDNSSAQSFAFDLLRLFRDKFRRTDFYKKKLIQRVDYISYASPTLTNYAKSITNEYNKKIIEPLPFGFFENIKEESKRPNEVIISVPGVVVEEARDYKMLFQVFEKVRLKIKKSIKLQLLGNSNNKFGKKIIQKFKNLADANFQLIYFQSALSQKEFDTFLRQTDFMILPIKKYRKFGLCKEEYGVSNISGGLNDMLRFGIPTLLTKDYKAESSSEMLVSYFETKNELVDLLREWINDLKFIEKRKAAIPFLEDYNEEKTRERLVDNLNNLYP